MTALSVRISLIMDRLAREDRIPVRIAESRSDGTLLSFEEELTSQSFDYPWLDVQMIMDQVWFDVA